MSGHKNGGTKRRWEGRLSMLEIVEGQKRTMMKI